MLGAFVVMLVLHVGVAAIVLTPIGLNLLRRRVSARLHGVVDVLAMIPLVAAFELSFVLGLFLLPQRLGESPETLGLGAACVLIAQPFALYASWRAVRG